MEENKKVVWAGIFAIAMAYLEAAVVVYLRRIYGIGPTMVSVPEFDSLIAMTEIGREAATMVMILAIALIAGNSKKSRIGYFLLVFGVWDIFYYILLKVLINWPLTLLDQDLLFLLPLPWWGPVLGPVLIAIHMIVAGLFAINHQEKIRLTNIDAALLVLGIIIVLYSFMKDALAQTLTEGLLTTQPPTPFEWPIYLIGYVLITGVVFKITFLDNIS